PAAGTYAAAIVADQPEAWWRLDEPADATELHDAMGRHDGVFNGVVTLGVPGAVPGDSDTAAALNGAGFGSVPFSAELNPAAFTFECWAKTSDLRDSLCPASSHYLARGFYFLTAAQGSGQWDAAFGSVGLDYYLPSTAPAATMQPDAWTYLVITFDPTNLFRFYINGQWDGAVYVDFDHNAAGPLLLGARGNSSGTPADLLWKGEIDEVAFYNTALSLSQVQAHYATAIYGTNTPPVFKLQPQSQVAELGSALRIQTRLEGTLPLALQWFKDGAAIGAETNETLTVSNLGYGASGEYQLMATNSAGFTQSALATIVAMPSPGFANLTNGLVLHLRFDNDLADSSGLMHDGVSNGMPVFVPGLIGTGAVQVSTAVTSSNYNYISIPYSQDLALSSTDAFALSFWINYTGTPDDLPIIGNAVGSTFQQGWALADKNGKLMWTLVDTNGSSVLANPAGGPSLNDGKWHNVVMSFDGAIGTADTYIDGFRAVSRSISGLDTFDTGQPICLGQDPTGTYGIDGAFQIDDLGIWRRTLSYYDAQAISELGRKYGSSFDTYGPIILTQTPNGNGFQLNWQAGALMEAESIDGPWSPVPDAAAPIYKVTPGAGNKFYRVKL
ncbi:MAG: LamG-like jellyroll fold domain-containing protein, partial [Limisphaerales bacterium]